jgi:hypothetical protein
MKRGEDGAQCGRGRGKGKVIEADEGRRMKEFCGLRGGWWMEERGVDVI